MRFAVARKKALLGVASKPVRPADGTEATYTKAEMFAEVKRRARSTVVSSLRRLDREGPDRPQHVPPWCGQGPGKQYGRWPPTQLEELALTCQKRAEVGQRRGAIGILANLPTIIWLNWGDDYIPLRQVRRAVATWAEMYQQIRGHWERAGTETAKVSRMVKGPGARQADVTAFAQALRELTVSKRTDMDPLIFDLGDRVIDPDDIGRRFGAPGASINTEGLLSLFTAIEAAAAHVISDRRAESRGSSKRWFSDDDYYRARQGGKRRTTSTD